MKTISFQIPNIKKSVESQLGLSEVNYSQPSTNFIEIQQKELESGFFCTQINNYTCNSLEWVYTSKTNLDYLVFCFWLEIKTNTNEDIKTHTFNIIGSDTDFSFKLKKNVLYKGFIFSLSQNWIKRNISSNIMKNYLLQTKNKEIKTLFFNDEEIAGFIQKKKQSKWQFNIDCWQLMGMVFEKIVLDIQNKKNSDSTLSRKKNFEILKTYIINNIHKSELNIQYVLDILKKEYPYIEKDDYQSLSTYIIEIRMNKAIELLQHGIFSIPEVAEKVGFSSKKTNQFSKTFKRNFGISPLEYTQSKKQRVNSES